MRDLAQRKHVARQYPFLHHLSLPAISVSPPSQHAHQFRLRTISECDFCSVDTMLHISTCRTCVRHLKWFNHVPSSLVRWEPIRRNTNKPERKAKVKPSIGKAKLEGKAKPNVKANGKGKADGQDQAQPPELFSASGVGSRGGS